jgi:hypothetical protein
LSRENTTKNQNFIGLFYRNDNCRKQRLRSIPLVAAAIGWGAIGERASNETAQNNGISVSTGIGPSAERPGPAFLSGSLQQKRTPFVGIEPFVQQPRGSDADFGKIFLLPADSEVTDFPAACPFRIFEPFVHVRPKGREQEKRQRTP